MHIEPTTRTLPRQSSHRRHGADALNLINAEGKGSVASRNALQNQDASINKPQGYDIVPLGVRADKSSRQLNSRRWRSYVPFLAQYIGQETAVETPRRKARRNSEIPLKAYQKQASLAPSQYTLARI